mgnify:CR=1 FL=1
MQRCKGECLYGTGTLPFGTLGAMSTQSFTIHTHSPEDTQALGVILAQHMPDQAVVALYGDLAAGKTCLTHGFGEAYAVDEPISSPTFTLVNEYHGSKLIYHLDLYRLTSMEELVDLGYEDLLDTPNGIVLIEWAERAHRMLPEVHINIKLSHKGEDLRCIEVNDAGLMIEGWQKAITAKFPQEV